MKGRDLHIGIIPDGSRRWGRQNGKLPSWDGLESGEKVREILTHILENYPEIREVTIWAMSTENFKRNNKDKQRVFNLIENMANTLLEREDPKNNVIHRGKIRINVFGTKFDEVPRSLKDLIRRATEETKNYNSRKLNVGLGYGGKFEIVMAAVNLAKKIENKSLFKTDIPEKVFERFLLVPRPLDLIIRTGGEKRLSGFMLYQAEYAELFFIDTLWPDFSIREFDRIMGEFRERERRFGK